MAEEATGNTQEGVDEATVGGGSPTDLLVGNSGEVQHPNAISEADGSSQAVNGSTKSEEKTYVVPIHHKSTTTVPVNQEKLVEVLAHQENDTVTEVSQESIMLTSVDQEIVQTTSVHHVSVPQNDGRLPTAGRVGGEIGYDEDDDELPVRHVVIDEDFEEESDGAENAVTDGLPYQDHNYCGITRSTTAVRNTDETNEPFPVMGGLASYLGEDDSEDVPNAGQRTLAPSTEPTPVYRQSLLREPHFRQTEQTASYNGSGYSSQIQAAYRIPQNTGGNLVTISGRTYVRQTSVNPPQGFRAASRESISSNSASNTPSFGLNTYSGTRRLGSISGSALAGIVKKPVRPSIISGSNSNQGGLRVGVVSTPSGKHIANAMPTYASSVSAASIAADPMRIANDNAPAPFIVPARGSRPSLRGRGPGSRSRKEKSTQEQTDEGIPHQVGGTSQCSQNQSSNRIPSQQVNVYNSNHSKTTPKYALIEPLEPCHVPQPERIENQTFEIDNDANVNVTSLDDSNGEAATVAPPINNASIPKERVETPVTSIVESAHRDAVHCLDQNAVDVIGPANSEVGRDDAANYIANSSEQRILDAQQEQFQGYLILEQHQQQYFGGSQQQHFGAQEQHQYYAENDQRRFSGEKGTITTRSAELPQYADQAPVRGRGRGRQRARSSHSASMSGGGLGYAPSSTPPFVGVGNVRDGHLSQSPIRQNAYRSSLSGSSVRGIRQVPISPGHVAGVFSHAGTSPQRIHAQIQTPQHQQAVHQQSHLIPPNPAPISLPQATDGVSQEQQFIVRQEQHAQLSSPEQQVPPLQSYVTSVHGNLVHQNQHAATNIDSVGLARSDPSPRLGSAYYADQPPTVVEDHNGDECIVNVSEISFSPDSAAVPAQRSSISAAEEETSFAGIAQKDPSEDKGTEEEEETRSSGKSAGGLMTDDDSDSDDSNGSEKEREKWGDYVTRCNCGLQHTDDFMIECDQCKVWQHCKCMGITSPPPKVYKCEICDPRTLKLTHLEARSLQQKFLARKRRRRERRKKKQAKQSDEKPKKKNNKKSAKPKKSSNDRSAKKFVESNTYEYSRTVATMARKQPDSSNISLIDAVRADRGVKVMYVAQNCEGLVSTVAFRAGDPVLYVCGRISVPAECPGREKPGSIVPFVTLYSGIRPDGDSQKIPVCVDARRSGSIARYARRSCRPNVRLEHAFAAGKLHIIGIASGDIDAGDEITVPFDEDFGMSRKKLSCACAADGDEDDEVDDCPVKALNLALDNASQPKNTRASDNSVVRQTATGNNSISKKGSGKVGKAKGMQKTVGRGRPRTASVVGKPAAKAPAPTRGKQPAASRIASTTTDEEMLMKKIVGPKKYFPPNSHKKGAAAARRAAALALSQAVAQKKKAAIKLKRRTPKDEGEAGINVSEVKEEVAVDESGDQKEQEVEDKAVENVQGQKSVPPASETPSKRQTRSLTAAAEAAVAKDDVEGAKDETATSSSLQGDLKEEKSGQSLNSDDKGTTRITRARGKHMKEDKKPELESESSVKQGSNEEELKKTSRMKRKSGSQLEQEVSTGDVVVSKKRKSDSVAESEKPEPCEPPKKHHKKANELPVEQMNYMLPHDRNKAMTREERKVQQEVALIERLQADQKRKEQRRLQQLDHQSTPSTTSSAPASGVKKTKTNKTAEEASVEKSNTVPVAKKPGRGRPRNSSTASNTRTAETKRARKSSLNGSRKSVRVCEREQEKAKFSEEVRSATSASDEQTKEEVEVTHTNASQATPQRTTVAIPPRKRWTTAAAHHDVPTSVEAETTAASASDTNSSVTSVARDTPAGVGHKAWILQRAQKEQQEEKIVSDSAVEEPAKDEADNKVATLPSKKRRVGGADAKPKIDKSEVKMDLTHEDAAVLLTQMAACKMSASAAESHLTKPDFTLPSPPETPENDGDLTAAEVQPCTSSLLHGSSSRSSFQQETKELWGQICSIATATVVSGFVDFSLSPISPSEDTHAPSTSAPGEADIVTTTPSASKELPKKKMSLDEYKKRKGAHSSVEEKSEDGVTAQRSFIPSMSAHDLEGVTRRSSLRLGSIPDPVQLREAPAASFDDLKRRIYGKQTSSTHGDGALPSSSLQKFGNGMRTPPEDSERVENRLSSSISRRTPPPPAPPLEQRMPLVERLRLVLGCDDGSTTKRVPPGPPPPPPPIAPREMSLPHGGRSPLLPPPAPPQTMPRGLTPPSVARCIVPSTASSGRSKRML